MLNYEAICKCSGWGGQTQNGTRKSKAQTQTPARSGTLVLTQLIPWHGRQSASHRHTSTSYMAWMPVSLRASLGRYRKLSAAIPAPENYAITSQLRDTKTDLILIRKVWLTAYHNEARIQT